MRMATKTRRWTRSDLARLPDDGNRYEVLDGELLVTPQAAFDHQLAASRLLLVLQPYLDRHGLGTAVGPGAVVFGKNELQPDVMVVPGPTPAPRTKWKDLPRPILVIEILSDSTRHRDFGKKRDAYERLAIAEYWVVDGDERRVITWSGASGEPAIVTDVLHWQPKPGASPLDIRLDSIFPAPAD
jgi:Uma2 family endonuclease